ncbi:MAG: hypothetical protein EOM87_03430 [Clostridia bacterium]|nr:hypothetical protein [Clostridia bacterium]
MAQKKMHKLKWWAVVLIVIGVLLGLFAGEIIYNFTIKAEPSSPEIAINTNQIHNLLYYLEFPDFAVEDDITIDNQYVMDAFSSAKQYMDGRYDCSDFLTPTLIRLQYNYYDTINTISPEGVILLKNTFLGFRYWMTEPGADSMCYWSENHQILFAVAEYLAGQMWKDEIFTNDGATGLVHMERAKRRINYWMEERFYHGFTEFNSSNYMPFNIAPMANFIQFAAAEDADMAQKMRMVMDLAVYDLASNMYNYVYSAPSGRAYVYNMTGLAGDRMRKYTNYIWNLMDDNDSLNHRMLLNFVAMTRAEDGEGNKFYEVPQVLLDIAADTDTAVIKASSGLYLSELEQKGLIGHSDKQIMAQFGMEAFTNPEVIQNTVTYFAKYNMFNSEFFNQFKYFNLHILKSTGLLKVISKKANPMPNGIAIQRANIYTYQTRYYQLATAQGYPPGTYGAQQMLQVANLTENAVVFTAHPARYETQKNVAATPGYWAGYGRAPHSAQEENIMLSIYQLPSKSGFLELYDVPQFTHTYLPEAYFDEVIIDGRYAFAKVGNAYIALIGASDLEYLEYSEASASAFKNGLSDLPPSRFDLVQRGLNQYWIYELSDSGSEDFAAFKARIKGNTVTFDGNNNLAYTSATKQLSLAYKGDFMINGVAQNLEYKRFDSPYIVAEREADIMEFSYNGFTLTLDYLGAIRNYN